MVKIENGLRFRNASPGMLILECPKRGRIQLAVDDVLDLSDHTQKDLDRFGELHRSMRLGFLVQETECKEKKSKKEKLNEQDGLFQEVSHD